MRITVKIEEHRWGYSFRGPQVRVTALLYVTVQGAQVGLQTHTLHTLYNAAKGITGGVIASRDATDASLFFFFVFGKIKMFDPDFFSEKISLHA